MEQPAFEKDCWNLIKVLREENKELFNTNKKLEEEIKALKSELNEKDARLLEAKCNGKN